MASVCLCCAVDSCMSDAGNCDRSNISHQCRSSAFRVTRKCAMKHRSGRHGELDSRPGQRHDKKLTRAALRLAK